MKKNFPGLDRLRFLLAFYIVIFHTAHQYPVTPHVPFHEILNIGGFATSTFFVLSGFILSHVYVGASTAGTIKGGGRTFLIKRLANLYPLHVMALLFFLAVASLGSRSLYSVSDFSMLGQPDATHVMGAVEGGFNLLLQMSLLQAWNPLYLSFNVPSWSLSTIFFFYLLFPFIAPRLLRVHAPGRALLLVWALSAAPAVMVVLSGWYRPTALGLLHSNPIVRLPDFIAGILAYKVFLSRSGGAFLRLPSLRFVSLAATAGCVAAGAYVTTYGASYWQIILHNGSLLPIQIAFVMACAAIPFSHHPHVDRVFARLGNASLSLFVLHVPCFLLFLKLERLVFLPISLHDCAKNLHACATVARAIPLEAKYYPVYLIAVVLFAIFFQERVTLPVRKTIENRLLPGRRTTVSRGEPVHDTVDASNAGTPSSGDGVVLGELTGVRS